MKKIKNLLADIEASESGPQIAALFDFDGTIMAGYSATVFLQDSLKSGDLSAEELIQLTRAMTGFGLGNLGFSALMAVHAQYLAGKSEADYIENSERLFRKKIARLIYPESRELIEAHRRKGHTIAIISSATPYQVDPAARDLDIEHVYCTELEVEDGAFTGGVVKPTVFGEGKVHAAHKVARKVGADLDNSFFYSDSFDDIQLLERVGRPVTLNPRKQLKKITAERNWPTATFDSRGKITVSRFIRSVAATSSLVGSFAAGLPILALTGSKRDSVNFSMSLFADTSSALIGMDLDVEGEEYLWSHRPAVFMFNHQSKADVPIACSLIRRDIVAVGKKEIRDMPLIGPIMGYGGTVFIDRSDPAKAIESMAPLIEAMREQGKSLAIAPEGTRTPTRKLAPFKKGGFFMAMQVGVPIVPIVIHNANDIAPKGDFLFKSGTVRVTVLPPVDTSTWDAAHMNEQVNDVRNMFLRTLGQPEQSVEEAVEGRKRLPEDMQPGKATKRKLRPPRIKKTKVARSGASATGTSAASAGKDAPETTSRAKTKAKAKPTGKAAAKKTAKKTTKAKSANKKPAKAQAKPAAEAPSKANRKKTVAKKTPAPAATKAGVSKTKIKTPGKKVAPKRKAAVKPKLAAKD